MNADYKECQNQSDPEMSEYQDFRPPCFIKPLCSDVLAIEGDMLTLETAVVGSPTPDVYWFKDGFTVIEDDYHSLSFHPEGRCCLTINYVRDLDEGEYECRAKNDVGHASTFGGLRVQLIEKDRMEEYSPDLLQLEDIPCEDIEGRQSGLFILFDEGSLDEDEEELKDYSALASLSVSEQIEGIIEDLTMAEGTASISLSREGVFISDESQELLTEDKDFEMFKNKETNDGRDSSKNENANSVLESINHAENFSSSTHFKHENSSTSPLPFKTNGNYENTIDNTKTTLDESQQYISQILSNDPTISSAYECKVSSVFNREESTTSSIDIDAPIQITEIMSPTEVINDKEPIIREDSEDASSKHSLISEERIQQKSQDVGVKIEELEDDTILEEKSEETIQIQEKEALKMKSEDEITCLKEQKDKSNQEAKSFIEDTLMKKDDNATFSEANNYDKICDLKNTLSKNSFQDIETQQNKSNKMELNITIESENSKATLFDLKTYPEHVDEEILPSNKEDNSSSEDKKYSSFKPKITEIIIEEKKSDDKNIEKDTLFSSESFEKKYEILSSFSEETKEFKEIHEEHKTDKIEDKHSDISLEKDQDKNFTSVNARKLFEVDPIARARRVLAECAAEFEDDTFDIDFKSPFHFRHRLSGDIQSDSGIGEERNRSGQVNDEENKNWFSENKIDDLRGFSSKWREDFEKEKKAILQEIEKSWPSRQKIWLDSHSSDDDDDFENFGLRENFNRHIRKDSKRSEDTLKDNDEKQFNSDEDTLASSKLDDEEMNQDASLLDGFEQKVSSAAMEQEFPGMSYSKTFEKYSFNKNESIEHSFEYNRVTGRSSVSKAKTFSFSESFDTDDSKSEPVFDLYVAIADYIPDGSDSEAIPVLEGQIVEVLDSHSSQKWLVRTRPSKTSSSKQGWVPPSYLEKKTLSSTLRNIQEILEMESDSSSDGRIREATRKRSLIVKELVETEEEFAKDMVHVVNTYLRDLENPRVPKEIRDLRDSIFMNFKQICDFHNNVLIKGVQYYANEPVKLGKTFLRLERDFDMHVNYCRDEPQAQIILANSPAKEYFEQYSQRIGEIDKTLSDHLKLPIQRINDYQLLLKELIKYSARLKEDCVDLQKALDFMLSIPQRAHDLKFINSIEGYKGNLLKLGRLLRHDWFTITDNEGKSKERYLFLFKSRILITKVRRISEERSVFILKDIIRLPDTEIKDISGDKYKFELHHKQKEFPRYPLTLAAKTEFIKEAWLKEIREFGIADSVDLGIEEIEVSPSAEEIDVCEEPKLVTDTGTVHSESLTSMEGLEVPTEDQRPSTPGGTILPHPPIFAIKFKDTEIIEGSCVTFMLKIHALPDAEIKFYKDDKEIQFDDRVKLIVEDKETFELVIINVVPEDAGKYRCTAKNSEGEASEEANVTISADRKVFIGIDSPAKTPSPIPLQPGESPDFKWYRDGQEFEASERFKVMFKDEEDTLALVFQHVKPEDAGLYTCVASTASGNISCSAELTVQGAVNQLLREPEAPKITAELSDTEVSAGGSAMLELKFSGYPKPAISWVKDKTEIQAGGRFRFLHEDDESIALIIKNVAAEDSGKYKVTVKNELGEVTTSADLIVKAPPKFKKQMKDLSVMADEIVKLEVEIEGKPTPEVTWYKDGQAISASSRIEIRHEKEETYSLTIKKVTSDDSGSYSCVASNSSGKISEFSNLSVNVPPTFLKEIKSVECKETDTVKFEVKVAGTPIPKVTWTKNDEEIKPDGKRIKIEQDDRNYSLTIEKVTRAETGKYSCKIANEHGSASSSGDLFVNCIPEFTQRLSDKTFKEGDENVQLEVKLSGTPTPKIKWFIESMEITEKSNNYQIKNEGETQVLIIKKVTPDCSGKLTCQATNNIGDVKTAAVISVLTKPKFVQSLSDQEVNEGDKVTFTVKLSGNPGPEIKWLKDNKDLTVDAHIKFTHESSETWSVTFDCVSAANAGEYECQATNSEGQASSKSKLIVNTKPKFEKGLSDLNAWLGLEADIEVKVQGIPEPEVKWFKNNEVLSTSEKLKFEKIEKTHRIIIKETVVEDGATYKCTIKNKIGEATTECTLKIKTPEDAKEPVCIKQLKDTITVIQEPSVFQAKILGNPKPEIKWMKDGVELAEGGLIHITEKQEEYLYCLTVEKSVPEDMGVYKIHASNEHGQTSSEANLDIHVPPEIIPPMDRKIMPKGKATFETTVTGRPQPKVSWHKNGKELTEGPLFQWKADDAKNLYTLTIDGADLHDAGEYECVAENVVGKAKQPFNLLITTEEPSFTKPLQSASIKPTTKAQFDVEVAGIPMPGVKWLRGGVELSPNFKTQIIQNSETSHSLKIDPFTEEDAGEYECKAISAAGEVSSKARLDVKHELPFFPKHVPKETCAIDGESFTLEAKVDGSPHPKVKWLKDGKELVPGDRIKMEALPDGTVRLTVNNAKNTDTGKYTLVATNESGEVSSAGLVQVEAVPKAPSIPEKLQKTEVFVGSPLVLKARVTGYPKPLIKWLKDGKPIKADRVKLAEQADGCVALIIDEARPDDAGKYTLIVKNNLGETSSEADVTVNSAPSYPGFHIKLKHTDVYEGYPITLEGKIIGYPLPTLQWLKDGQEIKPDGQRIIASLKPDGSFSLIVNDSTPQDAGKYTCVATNSEGTEKSEAEVGVKSRTKPGEPLCAPSFITPLRDTGIDEGLPLKLQAHIAGNPVPSISWFKDGEPLKSSDRTHILFDGDRVSLDIKNVTPVDAGKYECKLTSSEGTVSSVADVKIKKVSKPPIFTQRFPDSVVILAQDARFVCRVTGIPTPDITWYFNNTPLAESDKYKMKHEGDMYALYVKDCTTKDIGNVNCIARNIDGEENCIAFLNVVDKLDQKPKTEAPSFLKKLADCEIIEGMTAKFTACISGYPEPDFKWFKDGHELTQSERIHFEVEPHGLLRLLIKNVRADDVGKYSLKISNPHGVAESEASLNYEGYERKPKKPMADLNIEYEKVKKTGVPFALPDKPIISKMTDRRLTLSWKPSIPVGPRLPVSYIVEMCEVPDDNWYSSRAGVRGCCCEIRNLEPFRDYKFRIRVENKYGISDPSPYATAYRTKLEMSPPKYLPTLPAEFDFRPETSPYFPKDYDIEKPPHEAYAHAPRFLRQETDTQYGVRNQPSSIQWFVYGYPVPTISWYFEDEKIEVLNRYSSSFSRNGQATLYINRFLERDIGIYECVAVNEHGEARQRIVMNIAEPPVFSKQLDEVTVMIRDTACFECRVVGTPYPQIKWYKDWHPLASSNRIKIEWKEPDLCILTIHDTITKDAGLYSCSACNLAGMTSNSVMLTIEENEDDYAILSYSHSRVVKARHKPFEDFYDIGDELGRGTQGIIYHAVERATGNSYAGKIMHGKGDFRDAMNHELNIMNQLHDRHLIRGVDCFETKQGMTLITELSSGGELFDSLCKQSTLSEDEVAMYIRQVLWGLEHMHNKGIAHLGLTPGDLLLAKPGGDDIKICDFGLAQRILRDKALFLDYGMPEFVAPEIANKQPVALSADMWSVGVITYLLLSGISPFLGEHDRQTLQQVQQGRINFDPEVFSIISDDAKDFISKLLVFDPSSRLDVKQALKHPWLKWADRPGSGERFSTDRLKNYYRKYKDWVSNSACRRFYRRRPLSSAFTHPSRMVYPPDEQYTPPSSPEMSPTVRSKPPPWDMPKFEDKVDREQIDYDLGYIDSESRYQSGPDTYLLQLRDVGLPLRLREYMRVSASHSPTLGVRLLDTLLGKTVTIRERRRFTDVMDEEIDDEKKGSTDASSTQRRIISEVSPRSETKNRIKELIPAKAEDGSVPFFREKLHDESFVEDQEVELSCFAVGDPKPTVQWYRNDVILQKTHRLTFEETPEGRSILHFSSTKAFDAGLYKAIARNANGDAVCRARLRLGDVPGRMDAPEIGKTSDSEAFVTWVAPKDTGNTTIESYEMEYKDAVSSEWLTAHKEIPHEFFMIRGLKPTTQYQCRIRAKNKFGIGEFSVPSSAVRTLEEGSEKVTISKAMKHQQELTESGTVGEYRPRGGLDYSIEDNPINVTGGSPTDKYNFVSEIARGQFSVIVKCCQQGGDRVFAAKIINSSADNIEQARHEFEIMKTLCHEQLPCLYEAFSHNGTQVLIMEKLQGYNVLTYLTHRHEYSEEMVTRIISQILNAVQYLHFRSLVHLDIQPDNVVMKDLQSKEIKLVDFGSARKLPRSGSTFLSDEPGSLDFRAPEVVSNEEVSFQADIWSIGVLAYILLSGTSPFAGNDDKETAENINFVRYRFENLYKEITPESTRFLLQIFKRTPSKRPIADECLEHKWLNPSEYMLKKRERAIFLSSRLKQYADVYDRRKQELSKSSESLVASLGIQLGRSISVECDASTTF